MKLKIRDYSFVLLLVLMLLVIPVPELIGLFNNVGIDGGIDAFVAYRDSTTSLNILKGRTWEGDHVTWGEQSELPTSDSPIRFARVAYSPIEARRTEKIVVTLSDDGYLDAYVYEGTLLIVANDIGRVWASAPSNGVRPYDISYEQVSGKTLLVYMTTVVGDTNDLAYRTWEFGVGWSPEQYFNDPESAKITVSDIILASDPKSDKIGMVYIDSTNSDANAVIWNGSSWNNFIELTGTVAITTEECIAIEAESISGIFMAVAGDGQFIKWARFTNSWSTVDIFDINSGATTAINWLKLASSQGNRLMLTSVDSSLDLCTAVWDEGLYGNRQWSTASSSIGSMTATSSVTAFRFTAQVSKNVTNILVYVHARATPPIYRFGIETSASTYLPSGTYVGGTSNYAVFSPTAIGWQNITLPSPALLTAGTVYHITVRYDSETIGTSNYIALRRMGTLENNYRVLENTIDPWLNVILTGVIQNYEPIFALKYSDGTYGSNPYDTATQHNIYGVNWFSETWTQSDTQTVTGINIPLLRVGSPVDKLYVVLRCETDLQDIATIIIPQYDISTVLQWYEKYFDNPVSLEDGKIYRLILKSPSSASGAYFGCESLLTTTSGSLTYDGINSVYGVSANSGTLWTPTNTRDLTYILLGNNTTMGNWVVHVVHDAAVDSEAQRCADFAWEYWAKPKYSNQGLLVFGTTAGTISWQVIISPNYVTAITSPVIGAGGIHPWVQLKSCPSTINGNTRILGIVMEGTYFDIGAIGWNGFTFSIMGSDIISSDATTLTYECFEVEFMKSQPETIASVTSITNTDVGHSWLTGWEYRKSHVINPSTGSGTNYQMKITVHYGSGVDDGANVYLNGNCRPDFGDVRFTDDNGITLLDYWIGEKVNSNYAIFWVEIADDLSSISRTIYLYYGNLVATSIANGDNTFIFFDDFESGLSKWTGIGQLEGPYSELSSQHKMVTTSDGTIHLVSDSVYTPGSGSSYIKHSVSRDSGITWNTAIVKTTTPGKIALPAVAKDSSDNLYMVYGWYASADGKIYFRKGTVNKSNPSLWTWSWGADIVIDATTVNGAPDIAVDSHGYIHVAYLRTINAKAQWARSTNGGTTWTRVDTNFVDDYLLVSVGIDSNDNVYLGAGRFSGGRDVMFSVEKITYGGGTTWTQGTPVVVSTKKAGVGQLNVLPDDRICVLYTLGDEPTIVFRKTTNPRDVSSWDAEVLIESGIVGTSNDFTFAYENVNHFKVIYLSAQWHNGLDLVSKESFDGGATWSAITQLTNTATSKRAPTSLRQMVGGKVFLIYRDYADWETKNGNLLFLTDTPSIPIIIYGSSPTISVDYAYSGDKSMKFLPLITSAIQKVGGPTTNHAVHVSFYDQLSPLTEYGAFSFDAGESETSYIGIINDITQYEYRLQGVDYNSGVTRTQGWHEFVSRMSPSLKEFLIDGNLMPVTGTNNYGGIIIMTSATINQMNSYWDAVFETKYISPEPSHGIWSLEDNGSITTSIVYSTMSSSTNTITQTTVITSTISNTINTTICETSTETSDTTTTTITTSTISSITNTENGFTITVTEILPTINTDFTVVGVPCTITFTYLATQSHSPLETLTLLTTITIGGIPVVLATSTYTTTVNTGILVFGQGWSILIVPILVFAGLIVLVVFGKKRR